MSKSLEICRQSLAQSQAMVPRVTVEIEQAELRVAQLKQQKKEIEADVKEYQAAIDEAETEAK
jgi:DNA repair exonuclease SbcCD ATPase subunit